MIKTVIIYIFIVLLILFGELVLFSLIEKKKKQLHIMFFKKLCLVITIVIGIYCISADIFSGSNISNAATTVSKSSTSDNIWKSGSLILAVVTLIAQKTLSNVISGITISAVRPYDIGQKIKLISPTGDVISEGIVKSINLRQTVIKQYNGQDNIIPNSIMDSSVIVNENYTENVGNFLDIEISYESDIDVAKKIIKDIVTSENIIKDKPVDVYLRQFSKDGLILRTTIWTATYDENYKICCNIRERIIKEFSKNRICIPYRRISIID